MHRSCAQTLTLPLSTTNRRTRVSENFGTHASLKLKDSRKMMQLKFSVMTKHDYFALRRLQTHDQALRAAFTERMLQVTEEETSSPTFRDTLRGDLKTAANNVIKQFEGYNFDIVEQVLITSYVVE